MKYLKYILIPLLSGLIFSCAKFDPDAGFTDTMRLFMKNETENDITMKQYVDEQIINVVEIKAGDNVLIRTLRWNRNDVNFKNFLKAGFEPFSESMYLWIYDRQKMVGEPHKVTISLYVKDRLIKSWTSGVDEDAPGYIFSKSNWECLNFFDFERNIEDCTYTIQ